MLPAEIIVALAVFAEMGASGMSFRHSVIIERWADKAKADEKRPKI